jgi:hypothetical protein
MGILSWITMCNILNTFWTQLALITNSWDCIPQMSSSTKAIVMILRSFLLLQTSIKVVFLLKLTLRLSSIEFVFCLGWLHKTIFHWGYLLWLPSFIWMAIHWSCLPLKNLPFQINWGHLSSSRVEIRLPRTAPRDFGPSEMRALPLAAGINVGGHYKWHFFLLFSPLSRLIANSPRRVCRRDPKFCMGS